MESLAAAGSNPGATAGPGTLVRGGTFTIRSRLSLLSRHRSGVRVGAVGSSRPNRAFASNAAVLCCSSSSSSCPNDNRNPCNPATPSFAISSSAVAAAAAFVASAALLAANLAVAPRARAWRMGKSQTPSASPAHTEKQQHTPSAQHAPAADTATEGQKPTGVAALTDELLSSNPEALSTVRQLVYRKLELGEDEEALKILDALIAARPRDSEWHLLSARVLTELGRLAKARSAYDAVLAYDPWCFEALFENSMLMDRMGEGSQALDRLRRAEAAASAAGKGKEARDARLIAAQVVFLQKKTDEALRRYDELAKEDPEDYRPHFCKGVIYTLTGRDEEAKLEFTKCKQIAPGRFDVEGFAQTPWSKMELLRTHAAGGGGSKGGRTK